MRKWMNSIIFTGWIYDQIGSYAVSFFILSAVSILTIAPQVIIDTKLKQDKFEYLPLASSPYSDNH